MVVNDDLFDKLFYQCLRIRMVEEKIIELYPSDKVQSPVHLSIGQEASAVSLCNCLELNDWLFMNYRGHAHYLAKGGSLPLMFAELFGKVTGVSKGKAGSMHLASPENGVMGASAVVGSTISHAVGAALAAKIKQESRVFVSVFGDGATEQGTFHESLNFASLHRLPVLFVCENNGLAVHSPLHERQAYKIRGLPEAYGIDTIVLEEGYDVLKLADGFSKAVSKVRSGFGPVFVEVFTCRYREHVGPGEDFYAGYRSEADVKKWKAKDPLCFDSERIEKYKDKVEKEIEDALRFAEESEFPSREELLNDVF